MADVTIVMNSKVKANTEVTACVLQLGSGTFSQRINCNTVFSVDGNTGEPAEDNCYRSNLLQAIKYHFQANKHCQNNNKSP